MKAIIQERYGPPGDVLELRDIEPPVPGDDEVLVRVRATSVAGDDWHLMRGLPYVARLEGGLLKPKRRTPGQDIAGTVEAVGPGVTRFQPGDEVFGWADGAWRERAAVPQDAITHRPDSVPLERAAAVPISGLTALQGLRDQGRIQPGQSVLINGAAGGVGTLAVQIARALGGEVTGVCSGRNEEMVRSLGASHVVDYQKEDFTEGDDRYDLIIDLVANRPLSAYRRALAPTGTLVMVGGRGGKWFMGTDRWLRALAIAPFVRQHLRPLIHQKRTEDLGLLKELMESGRLTPVVDDRSYTLEQVVDAVRSFEDWHAHGKIIIRM